MNALRAIAILLGLTACLATPPDAFAQTLRGSSSTPGIWRAGGSPASLSHPVRFPAALVALNIGDLDPGLGDLALLRDALDAVEVQDWDAAHRAIAPASNDLFPTFVQWLDYRRPDTTASFSQIAEFLFANPGWPEQLQLRRNAEAALEITDAGDDGERLVDFFSRFTPLTGEGALAFLRHQSLAQGDRVSAAEAGQAWIETDFANATEETQFLALYAHLLDRSDHSARLARLVWERGAGGARRRFHLAADGAGAVATARLALFNGSGGVDQALAAVPESLRDDPALLYERLRWRRRRAQNDGAREILATAPQAADRLDLWARERSILSHRALEEGDYSTAFEIARDHGLDRGVAFAELEFLAGWLGLIRLDRAQVALDRFSSLYHRVSTPISRARGSYWAGRAATALGDGPVARRWYEFAAHHPSVFYGQQALLELGRSLPPFDTPQEPTEADRVAFEASEMVRITNALQALGEQSHLATFAAAAGNEAATAQGRMLAARHALALDLPHVAVNIAKRSNRETGDVLISGYPVLQTVLEGPEGGPEPALVLAVIRQESAYRQDAVSPVGARGLMQLMPATALEVAHGLGIAYNRGRLTADPEYNIRLGTHLLGQLLRRYDGSYALAVAAYNAGPHRVDQWLLTHGDPRLTAEEAAANGPDGPPQIDLINWIESVPFAETRNYIQRVLEAAPVYRQVLAASPSHGPWRIYGVDLLAGLQ